jgi:putative transcription factor
MSNCEMCGKDTSLVTAKIEGGELNVCNDCVKYGKVINKPTFSSRTARISPQKPESRIKSNYSTQIHRARESKQMTQQEFAGFLNEKESLVAKWESGSVKPSLDTARKIGRILYIDLIEQDDSPTDLKIPQHKSSGELTVGDFIKVRKRK